MLGWQAERNTKIQFGIALMALLLAIFLGLPASQLAIILTVSLVVIVSEIINTAIEELGDVARPDYNEEVKRIKDIAAGAVLVASVIAVFIGLILFVPPLAALLVAGLRL